MTTTSSFNDLSDRELLAEVHHLATREREATAQLVASLAEVDSRRLYLSEGCSSLFTYCTQVLHLSEGAAYNRIEAARTARRFPLTLERLANGSIHLTAIRMLAPKLTAENHRAMLDAARHKSKREIEHLLAHLDPQPDAAASIRKLPTLVTRPAVTEVQPMSDVPEEPRPVTTQRQLGPPFAHAPVVRPLSPERYKVQFTVSRETHDKLRRLQDLMRHTIPDGDPSAIFDRALTMLLSELEPSLQDGRCSCASDRSPVERNQLVPERVVRHLNRSDRSHLMVQHSRTGDK